MFKHLFSFRVFKIPLKFFIPKTILINKSEIAFDVFIFAIHLYSGQFIVIEINSKSE